MSDNRTSVRELGKTGEVVIEHHLPAIQENATNLNDLIDISCRRYRHLPAIGMALADPITYGDFHQRILVLAAALRDLGIGPGDRVAILSENSDKWGTIYFSIVRLGASVIPMFPDLPEADVHHILGEMECKFIFLTQRHLDKIYDFKELLSNVIMLDDSKDNTGLIQTVTFSHFLAGALERYGQKASNEELLFPPCQPDDIASILYTSGTSGFSKAVILTHRNLCANGYSASSVMENVPSGFVFLSVLPISHAYEFTAGFLFPLITGGRIVYAGKTPTPAVLQKICGVERPHIMIVVPLIMEKIYKKRVLPTIEKSKMLSFACKFTVGKKVIYRRAGNKLKEFFGNRLVAMVLGGAALNPEVEGFLLDAKIPFLVGYGLSEASPLISAGPFADATVKQGSVGKPVARVQVRIDEEASPTPGIGEIQATGPSIMPGYLNDAEATRETFTEDGWLKTGDLGFLDEAGNLHVTGRSKSVIVLSNGENIYPETIEHKINASPFVVESLVIENQEVLEAWIYPDYEFVDAHTAGQNRTLRHQFIEKSLEEIRVELNKGLPLHSRIARTFERREPFIKTATHKIKRYLHSAENMNV